MIQDVVSSLSAVWPRIALVFFVILFAAVLFWTFRGGRARFDRISRLPLDENDNSGSEPLRSEP